MPGEPYPYLDREGRPVPPIVHYDFAASDFDRTIAPYDRPFAREVTWAYVRHLFGREPRWPGGPRAWSWAILGISLAPMRVELALEIRA